MNLQHPGFFFLILFISIFPLAFNPSSLAGRDIPALPQETSVFDETQHLSTKELEPLRALLSEHQRLTDQKIVFGVFSDIGGEKEEVWSKRTFEKWKLSAPIKGDALLLSLFWQSKNARVELGFGLDSRVDVQEVESAVQECLKKRNLKQSPAKSLFCAAYKLLELLNSPLIESGKAAEIAQGSDIAEPLNPSGETEIPWPSILAMATGVIVLLLTLTRILLRGRSLSDTKLGFLLFWKKESSLEFISKGADAKKDSFEDEFRP